MTLIRSIIAIILSLIILALGGTAYEYFSVTADPEPATEYETEWEQPEEIFEYEYPLEAIIVDENSYEEESIFSDSLFGDAEDAVPADGIYSAAFDTDSSMFHVNEANEGRGILTVENGEMTIHISLASKNIVNLYPGLAEEAQKEGAVLLEPTVDEVIYSDGITEEVYGFDIPVPYLDEEFDVALVGTKGKWYDHKVSVSDPVAID